MDLETDFLLNIKKPNEEVTEIISLLLIICWILILFSTSLHDRNINIMFKNSSKIQ